MLGVFLGQALRVLSVGVVATLVCAASVVAQTRQADIVIVMDNSGSMDQEIDDFNTSVNGFLNQIIGGAGISDADVRLVLISGEAVCVPVPIGSGLCPPGGSDESLPRYRHVVTDVGSQEPLSKIISTYDQWSASLRAAATKTFIVLTDDGGSTMSGSVFSASLLALDPSLSGFTFHGIVPLAAIPGCGEATASDYEFLAASTGGGLFDICASAGLGPALDEIGGAIVDRLPAGPPPPPPPPSAFDPKKFTIQSSSSSSGLTVDLLAVRLAVNPESAFSATVTLSGEFLHVVKTCAVSGATPLVVEHVPGQSRLECQLDRGKQSRLVVRYTHEALLPHHGYTGQIEMNENVETIYRGAGSTRFLP